MSKKMNKDFTALHWRISLAFVLLIALVAGCAVWAMKARISGAVIAHGQVVAQAQVKEIQHPHGGVVSEILVENGDRVEAGDLLIRLDPTQFRTELGVVTAERDELLGRRARLEAVRDDASEIVFPTDFGQTPETGRIIIGERRVFRQDREILEVRRAQLDAQIQQYEEEVRGLESQRESNESERRILADDYDRIQTLVKKGLSESAKLNGVERDLAKLSGLAGEIDANVARVRGQIAEARLRIAELENQSRSEAQKELRGIDARLSELREREVAARDRLARTELRAPIAGSVNALQVHTVNGVIPAGETVMGIVPDGDLVVEAQVPTTDVDQVRSGQKVKLRFSAFNQRTTPEIEGEVQVVAAAATLDRASGMPFYLSSVRIVDADAKIGDRTLVPGMPVEVFFQTGDRPALSYLVKPFTDQMNRAFREE